MCETLMHCMVQQKPEEITIQDMSRYRMYNEYPDKGAVDAG